MERVNIYKVLPGQILATGDLTPMSEIRKGDRFQYANVILMALEDARLMTGLEKALMRVKEEEDVYIVPTCTRICCAIEVPVKLEDDKEVWGR